MAEHTLEIGNMERNEELFMEKMGFPRDAEGLELSDEQLINFLLLCYQGKMLPPEEMEETEEMSEDVIIQAAQCAQDAQAGYACDYCNKRQPMAFNEVKECCKGHQDLIQ